MNNGSRKAAAKPTRAELCQELYRRLANNGGFATQAESDAIYQQVQTFAVRELRGMLKTLADVRSLGAVEPH